MGDGVTTVDTQGLVNSDTTAPPPAGLPTTTHSFYYIMLILALGLIALIIGILVTIRDPAFQRPPSRPRSSSFLVSPTTVANKNLPPILSTRAIEGEVPSAKPLATTAVATAVATPAGTNSNRVANAANATNGKN